MTPMQCEIDRDSGARFHWRLVGGDGTELAVAATTFGSAQDARRAAADVRLNAGSANGAEESGAIEPLDRSEGARPEAERQLAAAAERYREVFASMQELGRPEAGQHVAVKAVGRAVHLVTFALTHAAESGVPLERLVELTGWEPRLVNEALARDLNPAWSRGWRRPGSTPMRSRRPRQAARRSGACTS
jgi:hypothetical protein